MVTTGVVEVPQDLSLTAGTPTDCLSFGAAAAQGSRDTMEDEAVIFPEGKCGFLYAMVLDGHDGLESVQWLTDHLFEVFSNVIDESMFDGSCVIDEQDLDTGLCCPMELSPTLTESFQAADKQLLRQLKMTDDQRALKSGSTATVALVRRNKIIVANVGDSRLVLCRSGRPIDLTTEHRVYGKGAAIASEIERVKATGGWIDDGRVCGLLADSVTFHAFTKWTFENSMACRDGYLTSEFASQVRFTGDPLVSTPDVTEMALTTADEFVIIATDGLWDVMSSADAVRFVSRQFKKGLSASRACENLVDLAIKRYTTDNVAAVVIHL